MNQSILEEVLNDFRLGIGNIADSVLRNKIVCELSEPTPDEWQKPEMLANFMLAYRHLEDARMRVGKILQAMNNGKSIYEKK